MDDPSIPTSRRFGDRYEIERELGRGGAATVYVARDQRLDTRVALKILRAELVYAAGRERFLREIRIASHLTHPHIVPILDWGVEDEALWCVMPLVRGESLRARLLREKQLPLNDAVRIARDAAEALAYAHGAGIVHRDVKPENILLADGHAWLADFGIARGIDLAASERVTSGGLIVGTPAYMSPEQGAGQADLDGRSDVYSLACVLYECLAGVAPFVGPTPQSVIAQRLRHPPRPLVTYRDLLPERVLSAVAGAMTTLPADRMGAAAFGSLLAEDASVSHGPAASAAMPRLASPASSPGWSRASRSRRAKQLVMLGAAGALAALAAVWIFRGDDEPLDPHRIVVFPLRQPDVGSPQIADVGIPTLLGYALESASSLRWVEGDGLLQNGRARGEATLADMIDASRRSRAAYFVDGSVLRSPDSSTVVLRLYNVAGDSVVTRGAARSRDATETPAHLALRAIGQLLPHLIETGGRVDLGALADRNPAAIAAFLEGEREFRRSRFASALQHYREALDRDDRLAVAALKAAQSARALFQDSTASEYATRAVANISLLPPRHANLARGLLWTTRRNFDSAAMYLGRAIELAPDWAEAHMAMGDAYMYLGFDAARPDSAAEDQYRTAVRLDSGYTPPRNELVMMSLRRGDVAGARSALATLVSAGAADSGFVQAATLMARCVELGPKRIDWKQAVVDRRADISAIGKSVAVNSANWECAEAALRAVFDDGETPSSDHYGALMALNALYASRELPERIVALVTSAKGRAMLARDLVLFDACAGIPLDSSAQRVATEMESDRDRFRPRDLWALGVWESARGRRRALQTTLAALESQARKTPNPNTSLMLDDLRTVEALASGDTARMIDQLRSRGSSGVQAEIEWLPFHSRANQNMRLARLLLATGRPRDAITVAERIDHPVPIANLVWLRESLRLRITAARQLDDQPAMERYWSHLRRLDGPR